MQFEWWCGNWQACRYSALQACNKWILPTACHCVRRKRLVSIGRISGRLRLDASRLANSQLLLRLASERPALHS